MCKPNDHFSMSKSMGRKMKYIITNFRSLGCLLFIMFAGVASVNGQTTDQIITLNDPGEIQTRTATIQLEDALKTIEDKFNVFFD
jgi:hypothetical protein